MSFTLPGRIAGAALAAALLASCTPALSGGAPAGPAPEWTASSSAGEIAGWMSRSCRGSERVSCMERELVALIDPVGINRAMAVLDTLVATHAEVRTEAHALAHGLGIAAYRSFETLPATFAGCTPSQMSGCYHGVIQGYFLDLERRGRTVGGAEIDALCAPHRESPFLHFQCAHGLGHGLMAIHGNHLPMALDGCDLASDDSVRESCYGGVFMENIVAVTHPHHTAAGHAHAMGHGGGADDHAGHGTPEPQADPGAHADHGAHAEHGPATPAHAHAGHGGHADHAASEPWEPLRRSEPLYPCTVVDGRYHAACYSMQSSAVLFFTGSDVRATARACERAPEAMVSICLASLGRDVTALARQDHGRSIDLCRNAAGTAGGRGEAWCLLGVAQNLVNLAADPDEGLRFCRAVADAGTKSECYRVVGESISSIVPGRPERAAACAGAEPEFAAVCRRGAGVE